MSARIYISRDAGALCVGAEEIASAFLKGFVPMVGYIPACLVAVTAAS